MGDLMPCSRKLIIKHEGETLGFICQLSRIERCNQSSLNQWFNSLRVVNVHVNGKTACTRLGEDPRIQLSGRDSHNVNFHAWKPLRELSNAFFASDLCNTDSRVVDHLSFRFRCRINLLKYLFPTLSRRIANDDHSRYTEQ